MRVWTMAAMAIAAGCSQSIFDSNSGGGGDGDGGVDATVESVCPQPCAGDAFTEFSNTQGGVSGNWFYLGEGAALHGADYDSLDFATFAEVDAWSAGSEGPAIGKCSDSSAPACAGLDGYLLLAPGPGGTAPALSFRVPESGVYDISGSYRVADGSTEDVAAGFRLSRNARHDVTVLQTLRTSKTDAAVSGRVNAVAGDELVLSINVADPTPLGFKLFFTRVDGDDAFPGSCQGVLRFSAGEEFVESCRNTPVEDLNDGIGPAGMSMAGPGVSGRLGEARIIGEAQFLKLGSSPIDRTGDFTIQFWSKADEPQPSFGVAMYADWNTAVKGGVAVFIDNDTATMDLCFMSHGAGGEREECVSGPRPMDGEWHFWRVVRSTADGGLALCIDGVETLRVPMDPGADMTSDEPPRLGRNVTYNPAYYGGGLDDVRLYSAALPCASALLAP